MVFNDKASWLRNGKSKSMIDYRQLNDDKTNKLNNALLQEKTSMNF
jgi:hypothetical protein